MPLPVLFPADEARPRQRRGTLSRWLLWACLAALGPAASAAPAVAIDEPPSVPLGHALSVLTEPSLPLTLDEVRALIGGERFKAMNAVVAGFGIGHRPVWIHLAVENRSALAVERQFLIGQTWLDRVDVYVLSPDRPIARYTVGDAIGDISRLAGPQGFGIAHTFPPGRSDLLFRVQTPDPMVFNLRLRTPEQAADEARQTYYGYGVLYGFLLSLAAYNALLFVSLGRRAHLWYSLYLFSFIALNFSYTGHGAYWLWSAWPRFQNYAILCMMVLMPLAGLRFARIFLELDDNAPRLGRTIRIGSALALGAIALATALDWQEAAAQIAFAVMAAFIISMVTLGVHAVRKGWGGARYFLAAALASMLGTALTEFSVLGLIPFNVFTFHGMEFGMMLDAIILALALAYYVRTQVSRRERAELEARMDALTQLYNRRGFLELAETPFLTAVRHQRPLSVLLIDIDHFKAVNDQYGHATGDQVLIEVARFLSRSARRGNVPTRWGGEEFILLLPETGLDEACHLAERLRIALQEIVVSENQRDLRVTASFGAASLSRQASLMELVDDADKALYSAKEAGRNRVARTEAPEV